MIELGLTLLIFIAVGVYARHLERLHYAHIRKREIALKSIAVLTSKLPDKRENINKTKLVTSTVSIADDLYKFILSTLRGMFGGRVSSYELVLDRARREAIIRLKEQCLDADAIINVHFCTSKVGRRIVEIVVYGTAIYWHEDSKHGDKI